MLLVVLSATTITQFAMKFGSRILYCILDTLQNEVCWLTDLIGFTGTNAIHLSQSRLTCMNVHVRHVLFYGFTCYIYLRVLLFLLCLFCSLNSLRRLWNTSRKLWKFVVWRHPSHCSGCYDTLLCAPWLLISIY